MSITVFDRVTSARLVIMMRDGLFWYQMQKPDLTPAPSSHIPCCVSIELGFITKFPNFHLAKVSAVISTVCFYSPNQLECVKFHFSAANIHLSLPIIFNVKGDVRFDVALRLFSLSEASFDSPWDMVTGTVVELAVTVLHAVGTGVGSMVPCGSAGTGATSWCSICISLFSSPLSNYTF